MEAKRKNVDEYRPDGPKRFRDAPNREVMSPPQDPPPTTSQDQIEGSKVESPPATTSFERKKRRIITCGHRCCRIKQLEYIFRKAQIDQLPEAQLREFYVGCIRALKDIK